MSANTDKLMNMDQGDDIISNLEGIKNAILAIHDDDYSTQERIIGKWIDGRNVYQLTVACGPMPDTNVTNTKLVQHGIPDMDLCLYIDAFMANTGGTTCPLPYINPNNMAAVCGVYVNRTHIGITAITDYSTNYIQVYVTIRYVKL
jgi:hypothetical protein